MGEGPLWEILRDSENTKRLTMMMMTMQPVRVLLNRLFSGKYGSSAPVTGFLMVIGAMAVNSGRGRSCQRCETHKFTNLPKQSTG